MREITWTPDEAARKVGVNFDRLTGGVVAENEINGQMVKVVRFAQRVGGRRVALRVDTRPELAAHIAELEAEEQRTVSIYLSSCGWGDYSALEWTGDITRTDADILAECRNLLTTGHDVDEPNQTDEQLLAKIRHARAQWLGKDEAEHAAYEAEAEDIRHKIETGYCFACESYCHGDCGHYSNDPMTALKRDIKTAIAEQNYGIKEG